MIRIWPSGPLLVYQKQTAWLPTDTHADSHPTHYTGWALEAYPELSSADMEAILQRMVDAGANVVWIGHNNPGEVDADKVEPGLSYAVYEAYLDRDDPRHEAALAIVQAQHRMLGACRAVGIKAVFPVGYQIQMGEVWNQNHPDDLRQDAKGRPLDIYGGGVSASFYAPSYRHDIEAYYRWVDAEFVQAYADVLLMLNLADEPIGGDYSVHAEAEFQRRFGFDFDANKDPAFLQSLGQFQSRFVVEYAIFSAELWQEIQPGVKVTMSFDGAQARQTFSMPDVEALFRDTPDNFVVAFDAYPHDGPPYEPLSDKDLVGLFLLARSVGLYSARYGKAVWLWAAANSWGLSQASTDPGTVSDAVANGLYLAMLVGQGGGNLQGIAYWNYNVKEQGLYNDTHDITYDPDGMFAQVSAGLRPLRWLMDALPDHPDVLILAPPAVAYEQIGATRDAVRIEVQPYQRLAILAKEGVNAAIVSSLTEMVRSGPGEPAMSGWDLARVRTIVVLSPVLRYLPAGDLKLLRAFLAADGLLITSPEVGLALADVVNGEPHLIAGGLIEQRGNLYVAQQGIAVLFEDMRHQTLQGFWQQALGLAQIQPGYRVLTHRHALHYHLGPEPAKAQWKLPYQAVGHRYDCAANRVQCLFGTNLIAKLGRREYLFLTRIERVGPRIR